MSEIKKHIEKILGSANILVASNRAALLDEFSNKQENQEAIIRIKDIQENIMKKWKLLSRIKDIIDQPIRIPNATVGKPYEAQINFLQLGWNDIIFSEITGLEAPGLSYDREAEVISGTPVQNGDFKLTLKFRVSGEEENSVLNEKVIPLVVNADPKSLWKNIPSDVDKDEQWKTANFWKPDNTSAFSKIGDSHIVVASKRGRSHANVGSFRDDDFSFAELDAGWNIVCVADGAGSAKLSRLGSKTACEEAISYFKSNWNEESISKIVDHVLEYQKEPSKEYEARIKGSLHNYLGQGALHVYKILEELAVKLEVQVKDFHTTLIFTLFKNTGSGYIFFTFGVGDCPIGILNKEKNEIALMNWLDVGEFGGGTRFITMPEIFRNENFSTRFGFRFMEDFSYLILMTDGIYDPKFVVESNLEKIEKWNEFMADLDGNNEEKIQVNFKPDNPEITSQLSAWMDFWSPGNHDDRTLAIVFK